MFEKFLVNFAIPKKNFFIILGAVFILSSFSIFTSLSYVILRQEILSWDVGIAKSLQSLSYLAVPMILVSAFGDLSVSVFLFLIALGFLYFKGYKREAAYFPAVLLAPILNTLIKESVARPRPAESLINVFEPLPPYSFPSGHVVYYVVFFGFLAFLAISLPKLEPRWRIFILVICLPLLLLIGVSRIYLGAHWPSDVAGGYLFGGLYLLVLILVYLKYFYRLPDMRNK